MRPKRPPDLTREKWLRAANAQGVQSRIKSDSFLEVYQTLLKEADRRKRLSWIDAVALLHMVYAWMPRMLRVDLLNGINQQERERILKLLTKAKRGQILDVGELETVMLFSNKSAVGASKVLHLLNPNTYPIWDSRVANEFLWKNVAQSTLNKADRYIEYQEQMLKWSKDANVMRSCAGLRKLNPLLKKASLMRLMELVLFRRAR